jgi:chemotaxis protein CheD
LQDLERVLTMLLDRLHDGDLGPSAPAFLRPLGDASGTGVYLQPGDLHVGLSPCRVTTIVGSCVAVCIHDAQAGLGGLNHYLLPYNLNSGEELRYGAVAIPRLVSELLRLGARKERLVAKVFGGACMLPALRDRAEHLGSRNVQLAYRLLAEHRIPIVARDVEGDRARKVVYQTGSGAVWLKKL